MRALPSLAIVALFGCADVHVVGDAGIDGAARDAGAIDAARDAAIDVAELDARVDLDAALPDAADDADLDAADLDAADLDAAELDAAVIADGSDGAAPSDAGPSDAGIVRTADPVVRPARTPIAPFTECTVTTAHDTISGAGHTAVCEPIPYPFHPPSAGAHFGQWAAFETYSEPVPWGFLVHAMEHGAVVLAYHCATASDCDAVRAEFADVIADHGVDELCRLEDEPTRIIVVPDPALPVPIAAVAWEEVYLATCLDPPSLRAFVEEHYGTAPEDFCFPGVDLSATGWCP